MLEPIADGDNFDPTIVKGTASVLLKKGLSIESVADQLGINTFQLTLLLK